MLITWQMAKVETLLLWLRNSFFDKSEFFSVQLVICVESCPSQNSYESFFCHYDLQDRVDSDFLLGFTFVNSFKCMYYIKTKSFFHRCLPETNVNQALAEATAVNNTLSSYAVYGADAIHGLSWFNTFTADLYTLRGYIFGFGIGVGTAVAFLYLYILQIPHFIFFVVWLVVIGIAIFLFVGSWLLWSLANRWSTDGLHSPSEIVTMRVFAYFGMAVTFLYTCLVIVLRKRIELAIGVVKEASRAMTAMPAIVLLPVVQCVGITSFLVVWVIYVFYLASSGSVVNNIGTIDGISFHYYSYNYATNSKYAFLYLLFCWFWTSEFIIAFGQLVIAMSFSSWYFTRDKSTVGNENIATVSNFHLI